MRPGVVMNETIAQSERGYPSVRYAGMPTRNPTMLAVVAGGGQVSALIHDIKPVPEVIGETIS